MRRLKLLVFLLARAAGVFALCRLITRHQVRILCYHGGCIGDESGFNSLLFCGEELFARRMQWLKDKGFSVITLDDALATAKGEWPPVVLPLVITFDDGWYSTGSRLLPILARYGFPSTLYLGTKYFVDGWPIIDVTVRYIIWKSPHRLLVIQDLGKSVDGTYDLASTEHRSILEKKITQFIEDMARNGSNVSLMLESFAHAAGVPEQTLALNSRRFHLMTKQELKEMVGGLCKLELHGHEHKYPKGDFSALQKDIRDCRRTLADIGVPEANHYCYPSGELEAQAGEYLEKLGVASAVTVVPGLVSVNQKNDLFFLPRFLDGGRIAALEFESEMSGFSTILRKIAGLWVGGRHD